MAHCLANTKFGILVTLVNIIVCVLLTLYNLWLLNEYVEYYRITKILPDKAITISAVVLVICVLLIILSCMLIVGIVKQNYSLMAPWMCATFVCLAGNFIYSLVTLCKSFVNDLTRKENFFLLCPAVLIFGLQLCLFYPIYVLYEAIFAERLKREAVAAESNPDDELVDEDEIY